MKYRILAAVFVVAAGVGSAMAQSITATKAYVDRKYDAATNAVPGIVTNEVTELSAWTFTCDVPEIQAAMQASPPSLGMYDYVGTGDPPYWHWIFEGGTIGDYVCVGIPVETREEEPTAFFIPGAYSRIVDGQRTDLVDVTATRSRITRNALGLAREVDLAGKADASITNDIEQIKTESALIYRLTSGSNIIMEVTNYNSRVNPPAMRLMRFNDETQDYEVMWTETNGLERTYQRAVSNTTAQVNAAKAEMAPRAWSKVTSGLGAEAPEGTTWVSTPSLVVAGGLEFQKVVTSRGGLWFLRSNGMMADAAGTTNGFFEITSTDGTPLFSIEKTDSYLVGVDIDGITSSGDTLTVRCSVVSEDHPFLRYTETLDKPVVWQKEEDGFTSPIEVTWSGSSGAWVATITTTASSGFFTLEFLQEGGVKLKSGGAMDVTSGGILCTDGVHKCRPVYNNGTITWEAF